MKNLTITVDDDVLEWARIEAARAWAHGIVDAIGGEFNIAIGANYY